VIRILHTITDVGPGSFGVGATALHLAYQQSRLGCDATFWSQSSEDGVRWASTTSGIERDKFVRFPTLGPNRLAFSPAMEAAAAGPQGQCFDVVHQHSIWTGVSRATSVLHKRHEMPVVIAPHGTLTGWALHRSRAKKRLALTLYEGENLRRASCFHAVANTEVAEIRAFGLDNPIAVIPNAIADTWLNSAGSAEQFRATFNLPNDRRIVLFLSRVSAKKGLPMLLQAIRQSKRAFADWLLVIAGADEFGHMAEVQTLIGQLDLASSVKLVGPLIDQNKRDAFAAADLFVLPSYSEGSPVVIPEALAVGVPVLATRGSPWPALLTHGCGWWTEICQQGIHEALLDAIQSSPEHLEEMGRKGRALISAEYTWSRIAPRTLLVYDWLLNRGPRPDFVVVD
jgi:glycosyltransferase involved in cell wall biosynthesis